MDLDQAQAFQPFTVNAHYKTKSIPLAVNPGLVEDLQNEVMKGFKGKISEEDWANFEVAIKSEGKICFNFQHVTADASLIDDPGHCYINSEGNNIYIAYWQNLGKNEAELAKIQFKNEFKVDDPHPDFSTGLYKRYIEAALKCGKGQDCKTLPVRAKKPVFMLLLGPSAAGKTSSSAEHLSTILHANGMPEMAFYTIDGGLLREVSQSWQYWSSYCLREIDSLGCSELNSIGKKGFSYAKKWITAKLFQERTNIMLVDTAAEYGVYGSGSRYIKDKVISIHKEMLDFYDIIPAAVYAKKNQCFRSGKTRAFSEGKVFPNKGFKFWMSWGGGMKAVEKIFNYLRTNEQVKYRTFAIVRNNYKYASTPNLTEICKENIMADVKCGGTGLSLYPYYGEKTEKEKLYFKNVGAKNNINSDTGVSDGGDYLIYPNFKFQPSAKTCYGKSHTMALNGWGKCLPNGCKSHVGFGDENREITTPQCPNEHCCAADPKTDEPDGSFEIESGKDPYIKIKELAKQKKKKKHRNNRNNPNSSNNITVVFSRANDDVHNKKKQVQREIEP